MLSVLPCFPVTDNCLDGENIEGISATEQYGSVLHSTDELKQEEVCSPFCICQHCRTAINCTALLDYTFQYQNPSLFTQQNEGLILSASGNIDKPPKSISWLPISFIPLPLSVFQTLNRIAMPLAEFLESYSKERNAPDIINFYCNRKDKWKPISIYVYSSSWVCRLWARIILNS